MNWIKSISKVFKAKNFYKIELLNWKLSLKRIKSSWNKLRAKQ